VPEAPVPFLVVAVGVPEVRVGLGAPVVGELHGGLLLKGPRPPLQVGRELRHRVAVAHKVERKLPFRKVTVPEEPHAKGLGVELEGRARVLDPEHRLRHGVALPRHVKRFVETRPLAFAAAGARGEDFDAVPVRVSDKGEALDAAVVGLLPEVHPELLEPPAGRVHVRDREADVPEAPERLRVAVLELLVRLPVVRQLDRAHLLQHVARSFGPRLRGVAAPVRSVAHEVEAELPLLEVVPLQEAHAQHVLVEPDRLLHVLHAQHRLLVAEVPRGLVRRGAHARPKRLLDVGLGVGSLGVQPRAQAPLLGRHRSLPNEILTAAKERRGARPQSRIEHGKKRHSHSKPNPARGR